MQRRIIGRRLSSLGFELIIHVQICKCANGWQPTLSIELPFTFIAFTWTHLHIDNLHID